MVNWGERMTDRLDAVPWPVTVAQWVLVVYLAVQAI